MRNVDVDENSPRTSFKATSVSARSCTPLTANNPTVAIADTTYRGTYSDDNDSADSFDIDAASNFSFGMAADILIKLDQRTLSEPTWKRFDSNINLRALATGTKSTLADLHSQAPSTSSSVAPSVMIPELDANLSLLCPSESLTAHLGRPSLACSDACSSRIASSHRWSIGVCENLEDIETAPLTMERPCLALSSSFGSSLVNNNPSRRESDVLKFTPSFLAVESTSGLLQACKDESGNRDSDDILEALRLSTNHAHLRVDDDDDSSIEYPRSSYQPLNSRSFVSVDMNSESSAEDRGIHDVPHEGGEQVSYFNQSTSEEARPLYATKRFNDSETEILDRSFGSTSTVDYGVILNRLSLPDEEALVNGRGRLTRFVEDLPTGVDDVLVSDYEDEDDEVTQGGNSYLTTSRVSHHSSESTEVGNGLDMITLLRELEIPLVQSERNEYQKRLENEVKGNADSSGSNSLGNNVGNSNDTVIHNQLGYMNVDVESDPEKVVPVLDNLLSRAEGENFSLGMGASMILNCRELLDGREPSECYTYPCRKSAFAQFLDEVALYDPDGEQSEEEDRPAGVPGQHLLAASSLWTIQEEEEGLEVDT